MADVASQLVRLRKSLFARTILLASLLVIATAAGLITVLVQAVNARVERNAAERLHDGASYFRSSLDNEGSILVSRPSFEAAVENGNASAIHEWLRLTIRAPVDRVLLLSEDGHVIDSE